MTDLSPAPEQETPKPAAEEKTSLRSTILRLVVASLIVGVIMKWIGYTPLDLIRALGTNVREIFENMGTVAATVGEWLLLGATIVIPVWIVMRLLGGGRGR